MSSPNIAPNPFTPRSGQEPKAFLGREDATKFFKNRLADAKKGNFGHFVVLGGWGTGKTTLLKEFKKIAQADRVYTSFVRVHEFPSSDLVAPVEHLLTLVPRNLPIKFDRLKKYSKYLDGLGITLPIIGGGIQIGQRRRFEGDPQALLHDGLVRLWEELKGETAVVVIFIDDAQLYAEVRKFLGILRNVLSDDDLVKKSPYLFVLAATDDGWSEFLVKNNPIGRYFAPPVRVAPFNLPKTREIIESTLKETGVSFSSAVCDSVFRYTEGHPYQLQILCSYLYENQIRGKVGIEQMESAVSQTLEEMGPLVLEPLLHEASASELKILRVLCGQEGTFSFSGATKVIAKSRLRISKGPLSTSIGRLTEKGLLVKEGRGLYRFTSRLLAEYIARQ